jgi:hypothetical protein
MVCQEGRGEDWRQMGLSGMRWLLKRWWFWAGAGFMLVAVVAGYLLIPVETERITEANYDKIQKEWSRGEVEKLLGTPKTSLEGQISFRNGSGWIKASAVLTWVSDDGDIIEVVFNGRGVRHKLFFPSDSDLSESPWDRMKRRIERRVRALWP